MLIEILYIENKSKILFSFHYFNSTVLYKISIPPLQHVGGGFNGFALSRPSVRLHYRVRFINPKPTGGFSSNLAEMFTSTRGWAEPMLSMCQLKVTIEGQISSNQILDIMSCPLCKSYTN